MEKILIDKNKQLNPGDVIEMHFKTAGMALLTAAQIALIEWKLEKRKDFRILSHSLPIGNMVIFTILITEPAPGEAPQVYQASVVASAFAIAKIIAGVTIAGLFYLSLVKVYQIMESPAGKVAVTGTALFLPALAVVAILILLRK